MIIQKIVIFALLEKFFQLQFGSTRPYKSDLSSLKDSVKKKVPVPKPVLPPLPPPPPPVDPM